MYLCYQMLVWKAPLLPHPLPPQKETAAISDSGRSDEKTRGTVPILPRTSLSQPGELPGIYPSPRRQPRALTRRALQQGSGCPVFISQPCSPAVDLQHSLGLWLGLPRELPSPNSTKEHLGWMSANLGKELQCPISQGLSHKLLHRSCETFSATWVDCFNGHLLIFCLHHTHQGLSGEESACNAGDEGNSGLIPGSGRSTGGGNGNLLQYSCLENLMDTGA